MTVEEKRNMVVLRGLPLPPSVNAMYATIMRHGKPIRIASRELEDYHQLMREWRLENLTTVRKAQRALCGINGPCNIRVDRYFVLHEERIYTRERKPKKFDVTNRIKALDDALAEDILGVDDSYYWSGVTEKITCFDKGHEEVIVVLSPVLGRSRLQLLDDLGTEPRLL